MLADSSTARRQLLIKRASQDGCSCYLYLEGQLRGTPEYTVGELRMRLDAVLIFEDYYPV